MTVFRKFTINPNLVYTKPVNSAFRARWLASLEVNSKYYSPPSKVRWLLRVTSVKKASFDPQKKPLYFNVLSTLPGQNNTRFSDT